MAVVHKFEGRRSRGIVCVCDIASSSKYLNNDQSAEALEQFLQRFLFLSTIFVEAAGGTFIKWTGDGFLAWFETPLHRDVGDVAFHVFHAAWQLTFYVNVTQLCVPTPVKFKIRHAVTLEHDALVIDLAYADKVSTDVLGRAVVLAFRLSSIKAAFPCVITHQELLKLTKDTGTIHFKKLKLSQEDRMKYFKDETWGTKDLFASAGKAPRAVSPQTTLKRVKRLVTRIESGAVLDQRTVAFATKVVAEMASGPDWCREVEKAMYTFRNEGLLQNIKNIIPILEKTAGRVTTPRASS